MPDVLRLQLFQDVGSDSGHIAHHRARVFEYVFVDLLMDVADARAALAVRGGIGFVDVADFEGFGMQDFAVNLEFFGYLFELLFLVGHRRFFRLQRDEGVSATQTQKGERETLTVKVETFEKLDIGRNGIASKQVWTSSGFRAMMG